MSNLDQLQWKKIPGRPDVYRLETLVGVVKVYNQNPIKITFSGPAEKVEFDEYYGLTLEEAKDLGVQWAQMIILLALKETETLVWRG